LRECEHRPERNSKVEEWHRAAVNLELMGYHVVVVRDTFKADEPLGKMAISTGSNDLNGRARLYASAACNLFVSNGPAWFCMALDAPTVVLRPATEGLGFNYSARMWERNGVPPGGQIPGAPPYQRLVWEDDTFENIVGAACRFMEETRMADVG
jgi:hypothetical protein